MISNKLIDKINKYKKFIIYIEIDKVFGEDNFYIEKEYFNLIDFKKNHVSLIVKPRQDSIISHLRMVKGLKNIKGVERVEVVGLYYALNVFFNIDELIEIASNDKINTSIKSLINIKKFNL